jgi:hypothetical protein
MNNEWIHKPKKTHKNLDMSVLKNKIKSWTDKIDDAIEDAKSEGNVETLKGLKDKLKDYRQSGLDKDGEFSYENLVFKYLRRSGHIGKLFDEKTKIPFADSGMPGTIAWKESWTKSNNDFYNSLDYPINDFILALDPSMYFYWNGLKIMSFEMTLEFKLHRYIPSDYVDFIILKELYPNITTIDIYLNKSKIWENKHNRSNEKINQLIIKSFDRYLIKDKRRINIYKYFIK